MPTAASAPASPGTPFSRALRPLLAWATGISLVLVLQNFCLDILPHRSVRIPSEGIRPYSAAKTFAYVFAYEGSEPDAWPSPRSRVSLFEDGVRYSRRLHAPDEVIQVGGDRYSHERGRIVFASTDNTDPRTNGRTYRLSEPVLYSGGIGDTAALVLAACVAAWWRLLPAGTAGPRPARGTSPLWRWHLAGAATLFLLGLYCNTGTLAPYACTSSPIVFPQNGYAYNGDHRHFRVLFDFVDGRDRSVWNHALLLRRILFPALGWPLMKLLGFEIGGTIASLALNLGAFVASMVLLRRMAGERAAVFAGWILALYPGAAYWAGLPYPYALICPASLLLMLGLMALSGGSKGGRMLAISLAMGIAYLGYDLAAFFVPATLLVLCRRRRFADAIASAAIQMAPSAAWVAVLKFAFGQPLENPNSGIYHSVLLPYLHPAGLASWWDALTSAPAIGMDIFFAANFLFLPALFLLAVVANPLTSRIRISLAEASLLASALALFLVLNLAPGFASGWAMNGTWISRLYQPVFPALLLYAARWWQALPPLGRGPRAMVGLALAGASLGDALIVLGPILGNPLGVSEAAFYRFYDHTDAHFLYESNLQTLGRRPLGFPRRQKPPPAAADNRAAERRRLDSMAAAVEAGRTTLIQNKRAYRDTGRDLATAKADLYAARLDIQRVRGEISSEEELRMARTWRDFAPAAVQRLVDDASLDADAAPRAQAAPVQDAGALAGEIDAQSAEIAAVQEAILGAQREQTETMAELTRARAELDLAQKAAAAARP